MGKRIVLSLFIAVCLLSALSVTGFAADKAKKNHRVSGRWNNEGDYPFVHEYAETRFEAANPGVDVQARVYKLRRIYW